MGGKQRRGDRERARARERDRERGRERGRDSERGRERKRERGIVEGEERRWERDKHAQH